MKVIIREMSETIRRSAAVRDEAEIEEVLQ
jgi:hypothetical protein